MSGEIEVTQLVETIEVKAGDTVEVTQQLSTIEVVDGDTIEVTETQGVVELKAGDVIEVAEEILQVVIDASGGGGGGPHKSAHVTGGGDALVKGDVLAAAARYLETLGSDPGGDVARFWLNGALLKYYDNAGDEILQIVQKRGDVIDDGEHGARGTGLHLDSHAQSHPISDTDHHTGAISAAQHGTPAGDLHTGHALLAGRAGATNDIKLSTTIAGIITGSSASGQKLSLRGTDHATPGLVEVQRASVTVSAQMFQGLIGAEAQPRWGFGFDSASLVQLGFGVGGATAMDSFLRRTATRTLRLVSTIGTVVPTLGFQTSTDTQPRLLLGTRTDPTTNAAHGAVSLGVGGSTAADTHLRRFVDPGHVLMPTVTVIPNIVTVPAPSLPTGETEPPAYLYARPPSQLSGNEPRLFYQAYNGSVFNEIGPVGTLRGTLRQFNLPIGGMAVFDGNGAPGTSGFNCWGLLGTPNATSNSSANAAYSPALSLTNAITATQTIFTITGGLPLRGDVIVIDSEKIQVTQTDGSTQVTACIRGAYLSTAAAHLAAAPILLAGGATATVVGQDGEPALQQDTGTTSGDDAALEWHQNHCFHSAELLIYKFDLRNVTDIRHFIGFTNQSRATMLASDNPAGEYFGLQYSTGRGDTEWKIVSKDGTTQTVTATGWGAPAVATKYYLRLVNDIGTDFTASLFTAGWVQIGSDVLVQTTTPSIDSALLRLVAGIRNLAAASKRIRHMMVSFNISPSVT